MQSTYAFARSNGIGFHVAAIPINVAASGAEEFETEDMRRLYQYGLDRAGSGNAWVSTPSESRPQVVATTAVAAQARQP